MGTLRHKLVLIVDDDAESRILLTHYLEGQGCSVITARTGAQGVDTARTYQPDLIVLDIHLPDISGWEVLSTLRADPLTRKLNTVIVSGGSDSAERAILENLDAVKKPVDPESLFNAVSRNVRRSAGRVLIVDDSEDDRTLMTEYIRPHVEDVRGARDGREGLKALSGFTPDLIILDLLMPRMDGFEFIARLRANPAYRDIPVLVVTGKRLSPEEARHLKSTTQGVAGKDGQMSGVIRSGLHGLVNGI